MFNPLDPLQVILAREKFKADRVRQSRAAPAQAKRAYLGLNYGPPPGGEGPVLLGGDQRADRNAVATLVARVADERKAARGQASAKDTAGLLARDVQAFTSLGLSGDADLTAAVDKLASTVKNFEQAANDQDLAFLYGGNEKALEDVKSEFVKALTDVEALVSPATMGLLASASSRQFSRPALQEALSKLTTIYQTTTRFNLFSEVLRGRLREVIRRVQGQLVTSNLSANPAVGAFTPPDTAPGIGRPTPPLSMGTTFPGLTGPGGTVSMPFALGTARPAAGLGPGMSLSGLQGILPAGARLYNFGADLANVARYMAGMEGMFNPLPVAKPKPESEVVKKEREVDDDANDDIEEEKKAQDTAARRAGAPAPSNLQASDTGLLESGLAGDTTRGPAGRIKPNAGPVATVLQPGQTAEQARRSEATYTAAYTAATRASNFNTATNNGTPAVAADARAQQAAMEAAGLPSSSLVVAAAVGDAIGSVVGAVADAVTGRKKNNKKDNEKKKTQPSAAPPTSGRRSRGTAASDATDASAATDAGYATGMSGEGWGRKKVQFTKNRVRKGGAYFGFEPAYDFNTSGMAWRNQMPATALGQQPSTPPHSSVQPYTGLIGREPGKVDKYRPTKMQKEVAKRKAAQPTGVPIVDDFAVDVEEQEAEAQRASDLDSEQDEVMAIARRRKRPAEAVGDAADKIRARDARSRLSSKRAKMLNDLKANLGRSIE